jgi:beta-glucanase (GH16 family)
MAVHGVAAAGWQLVWSDEFNYQGLPDTNKWSYEEGFIRNHERQYYTKARLENARVEDGHLVIECRKEQFTPTNHAPVEYTAASLTTQTKASWQYGRIEVRAKIPQGKGVWPAIWMLGTNITQVGWPRCGEIDIMEFVGKEPDGIHGTVHYAIDGQHQSDGGTLKTSRPFDTFHVYAVEWTPERIDFYYDTTKYHPSPSATPTRPPAIRSARRNI